MEKLNRVMAVCHNINNTLKNMSPDHLDRPRLKGKLDYLCQKHGISKKKLYKK